MNTVNGERLRNYREALGFSLEYVGAQLGVTRQTVAAWEGMRSVPSVAQLLALSRLLSAPVELLLGAEQDDPALGDALFFRADQPKELHRDIIALLAAKAVDYAAIEELADEAPALPPAINLEVFDPERLERVASDLRDWLGCCDGPLVDPMSALEAKGIKTIRYPMPAKVSGFSAYTQRVGGVIFINRDHPTERQYFTAMHELAHLVLHRAEYRQRTLPPTKRDDKEKSASYLAGAILLPGSTIVNELHAWRGRWLPVPLLQDLKARYCVSMRTILMRAEQVGLISKLQCGQQIGRLNQDYGQANEPGQVPKPQGMPRFTRLVYTALLKDRVTSSRAAELLSVPIRDVNAALVGWLGGGNG